ncbi:aldehyde dehydrogenase [Natrarchaeobius oligotrophus]|uniref:Aldehyde dehydrogenase n=1 Tax=Natrarchaeobius chitinivorans TaxID=1679083 RepID=A0A3N6MEX4_NATCH|nr:aldehyde dehydrogenase [Natrarchaeobius chitinivorans]RQH02554.1 aldehyde dehydrogenase [Natrarchaeobius chitinivorans]
MSENQPSLETVTDYDLLIDGDHQASATDERIAVSFPYTGEEWATVPRGDHRDVDRAVEAARRAYENGWKETLPSTRRDILTGIADVLDEHYEELGRLETLQNGKLLREMEGQLESLGEWYRYNASLCDTLEGAVIPVENKDGGMFNYTQREPYGVVGAITPWNSPLLLLSLKLAPALAAGNAFVHKPSEHTPVSALRFGELVYEETDLPEGVYNVVTGDGEAGKAVTDHDGVDKLTFTGSTAVGRQIGKKAGERLIPASLELGGKSPNVVFPDANLENAVTGAIKGIFAATGQTCVAGSRVLVAEEIYDEFVDRFVSRAADIELGDPLDPETEMGPIAFPDQWEKVNEYVDIGTSEGATLAYGGEEPGDTAGDLFVQPTILTDVENDMRVAQEEIFGPVASVIAFADEDEAIRLANDTEYGLAAGVWTEDMRRAHRVADRIEAGTVCVNEYRLMSYRSPIGGYKDSGLGREQGKAGLEEYLQTKSVWMDLEGEVSDPFNMDT